MRISATVFLSMILFLTAGISVFPGISFSRQPGITGSVSTIPVGSSAIDKISPAPFSDPTIGLLLQEGRVTVRDLTFLNLQPRDEALSEGIQQNETPILPNAPPASGVGSSIVGSTILPEATELASFDGINAPQGGANPPDPQVAAGPGQIMEMANHNIEIFSKQGVPLARLSFHQFFNNSRNEYDSLVDPKVLFDAPSATWFASVSDETANNVTIAVSTTSDPTGIWKIYSLSANGDFPDQPIIGVSDDKFIVTANDYVGREYVGAQVWVFNKSQMVAGAEKIDFFSFGPMNGLQSIHPVQSLSSTTTLYMVTTGGSDINSRDFHFYSVVGVPPERIKIQTIALSISAILPSVGAAQPGTSVELDTGQAAGGPGDARIQSAAWFQGKLWLAFDDGCTPPGDNQTRSCFRLTEIDTAVFPMMVKQDFDVGAKGLYYFYPALSIDSAGNLAVVFGYSSSTSYTCCYASIGVTAHTAADPANTFRQPITVRKGNSSETGHNFIGTVRFGDYFGASVDPSNQTVIWVAGEYLTQSPLCGVLVSCWATHVASVTVLNRAFSLSTEPTYVKMVMGSSNTTRIVLRSIGEFAGSVTLSTSLLPNELSASWSATDVNLTAGGRAISTLTIKVPRSTASQSYTVEVTATSGTLKASASVFLSLTKFNLLSEPRILSLPEDSTGVAAITITSTNGFSGAVQLGATVSTPGPKLSLSSTNVELTAGSVTSTLSVSVGANSQGVYLINVTGTSGSELETLTLSLVVGPFTIHINSNNEFKGVSVSTVGPVVVDLSNQLSLAGRIRVTATNSSTGVSLFTGNYTIVRLPIIALFARGISKASLLLDIPISPYPLASEVVLTFSGNQTSIQVGVTRNPDVNLDGVVDQVDASIIEPAMGCMAGMKCFNPRADLDADGIIDGVDVGILEAFMGVTDFLADFTIFMLPSNVSATAYSQIASSVSLKSINGFAGKVGFTVSVDTTSLNTSPFSLKTALATDSVMLSTDGSAVSALKLTPLAAGDFAVNVTGTSGSLSHSAILTVHVDDFRAQTATSLTFINNSPGSESVLLTSINGFSGNVSLSASVSPIVLNGPIVSISPSSVSLASGWTTSFVSVSTLHTPPANYTLTLTGSRAATSHSVNITLTVFDFYVTVSPDSVRVSPGNSTSVSVQGHAVNGYANDVSLTVLGLPSCVTSPLGNGTIVYVNRMGYPNASMVLLKVGVNCPASLSVVTVQAFDSSYGVYRRTQFTLLISVFEKPQQCDSHETSNIQDECESCMHRMFHSEESCSRSISRENCFRLAIAESGRVLPSSFRCDRGGFALDVSDDPIGNLSWPWRNISTSSFASCSIGTSCFHETT